MDGFSRRHRSALVLLVALVLTLPAAIVPADGRASGRIAADQPSRPGPEQGTLWVEENNLGRAGGLPPDFTAMFTTRTGDWTRARDYIGVYLLRMNALEDPENGITDDFLGAAFLPTLEASGIGLALDVNGATWAQCREHARVMFQEAEQIDRIMRLGGEVRYLSLQSALSKPSSVCLEYGRDEGYDLRIADVVRYVGYMKGRYPGVQVGLIDAMPAKGWDYQPVYRQLVEALRAQHLTLDYLHLDFPMEAATADWANARAAEDFVRHDLGLRVGITYTSKDGGRTSNEAFYANVLEAFRAFRAAGGRPDDLWVTSWYPHPTVSLPEDATDDAPLMKVVLDFARLGGVTAKATPGATPEVVRR